MAQNYYSQDVIYEPLKEYDKVLRDMHNKNVETYYEELVKKSDVNVEENKNTVKEIKKLEEELKKIEGKHTSWRNFKIFSIVIAIIMIAVSIYLFYSGTLAKILIGVALILAAIGLFLLVFLKINPTIKNLTSIRDGLNKQIREKYRIAWDQMEALNKLFKVDMAPELFHKTLPLINLDQTFDSRRLEYLVKKFGLDIEDDKNRSTLYVQSGDINGNPFYISDNLYHQLGVKTYTGSIVIHWTSTGFDSKGNPVTRHHSQTLTASVTKPCPYYATQPFLVYGNEAAPDLIFSRTDSDAEVMNEKQIDRHVKKEIKKLHKKTKNDPEGITVLGNQEFEILWKAQNRNNEVQFRLLFTVLAQRELLALMKDKTIGFGDDFNFVKDKMINIIYPEHLSKLELNIRPEFYHSYDIEESRNRFIKYQNLFFKHIYFTLAPILAIPLYQQHKPREYIYKDLYKSYVSFYEHEKVANMIGESHFKHPLSGTRNILKTSSVKSNDYCDYVTVSAYGYETIPKTDYVTKMGGDGKLHTIPVHWTEYIPVEEHSDIEVHVPREEKELTYEQRFRQMFENLKDKKVDSQDVFRLSTFLVLLNKKNKEE